MYSKFLINAGKFGIYCGLILIVFTAIIYIFDVNTYSIAFGLISFALTFGVLIIFMFKGTSECRDQFLNKSITYWQSLVSLFVIGIIGLLLSDFFNIALNEYIDPNYADTQLLKFEKFMNKSNVPENMRDKIIEEAKIKRSPEKQLYSAIIFKPLLSLILSLIFAFFVRKNPKNQ